LFMTATVAASAAVAGGAAYVLWNYPPCASLGATREERDAALAGDELIAQGLQSTRVMTVQAPPAAVWPWLVQMGQDRGGFYSYDWLERTFGAEIRNRTASILNGKRSHSETRSGPTWSASCGRWRSARATSVGGGLHPCRWSVRWSLSRTRAAGPGPLCSDGWWRHTDGGRNPFCQTGARAQSCDGCSGWPAGASGHGGRGAARDQVTS
jgi:hypothetical protein